MLTTSLYALTLLSSPALGLLSPPPMPNNIPPRVEPTMTENFTWSDPFSSPKLAGFDTACESERTFTALEYQLHDLQEPEPKGLWPYGDALKALFGGRGYPGGWEGIDAHGYERILVKMEYTDVPVKVREWIEEQERSEGPGKGLFGVYDKPDKGAMVTGVANLPKEDYLRPLDQGRVAIFAPGAVYETLPLWVAEGSDCEGMSILKACLHPQFITDIVLGRYNGRSGAIQFQTDRRWCSWVDHALHVPQEELVGKGDGVHREGASTEC